MSDIDTRILVLLAAGMTHRQIAGKVELSKAAVDKRVQRMCARAGGITRTQLVLRASADGAITV